MLEGLVALESQMVGLPLYETIFGKGGVWRSFNILGHFEAFLALLYTCITIYFDEVGSI